MGCANDDAGTGGVEEEVNKGLRSFSLFVSSLFSWRGRVSGGTVCIFLLLFGHVLL